MLHGAVPPPAAHDSSPGLAFPCMQSEAATHVLKATQSTAGRPVALTPHLACALQAAATGSSRRWMWRATGGRIHTTGTSET